MTLPSTWLPFVLLILAGCWCPDLAWAAGGAADSSFVLQEVEATPARPHVQVVARAGRSADSLVAVSVGVVDFYTTYIGSLRLDTLCVVQLESMPFVTRGLTFVPALRLDSSSGSVAPLISDREAIALQLAKQWWGSAVAIADTDAVLQEGLRHFMALLYVYTATEQAEPLYDRLLEARGRLLETADHDAAGAASDADRGLWLIHMLRNLLVDQSTMSDEAFQTVIRSFFHSFKGRKATLHDLRMSVEDVVGFDMRWYFDQWARGRQIPAYTWAWASTELADGTFSHQIRVTQANVADAFRMYIPIKVMYADKTFSRFRVQMVGSEAVLDLPVTSTGITDIIFNEFESVLCTVEEEEF